MKVKRIANVATLDVTCDGEGIVGHAGARLVSGMAEMVGLDDEWSTAMAPTVRRRRKIDPGRVLVDLAVTLADGGDCVSDLRVLRDQPELFGPVASGPTAWRAIDSVDNAALDALRAGRAKARAAAWAAGAAPAQITLDFDATLVTAHSDKDQAAPNYKKGFGFHPLGCWLDETNEALAAILRPGNAGSNTAADHVAVLDLALAQLPVGPKGIDPDGGVEMLARADSAGATHGFINALRERGIGFSVGFDITNDVRMAILALPNGAWSEAIGQDAEIREGAQVAELTTLLDLSTWPVGTRAIVRREEPHPGAQFNLFDPDGWRHQVFITDSTDVDISYLEARHRGHARVEDRIRCAKDTGLRNFPFRDFAANCAWLEIVLGACDLIAWTQRICLDGELAKAEPKRLRYALLHTPGRLAHHARRTVLRLAANWPWNHELRRAFVRLRQIPRLS
ncbi:MAG: IS1380-like element ISMsm3 family transposase [Acidimicrobiales bacterium]